MPKEARRRGHGGRGWEVIFNGVVSESLRLYLDGIFLCPGVHTVLGLEIIREKQRGERAKRWMGKFRQWGRERDGNERCGVGTRNAKCDFRKVKWVTEVCQLGICTARSIFFEPFPSLLDFRSLASHSFVHPSNHSFILSPWLHSFTFYPLLAPAITTTTVRLIWWTTGDFF